LIVNPSILRSGRPMNPTQQINVPSSPQPGRARGKTSMKLGFQ
jgi:hypothetical protein